MPKLLGEQLADRLWEKVPSVGADGKTRMISPYDLIIERFIEELPNAKPKEIVTILNWMEKLSVFDNLRAKVTNPSVNPFVEEHGERLAEKRSTQALDQFLRRGLSDL